MYDVKITEQAKMQMRDIVRYIAHDLQAPGTARKMLNTLENEINALSVFPGSIPLTEEEPWHSQGVHKMTVRKYLVYFWIDEERKLVQIFAVVYGKRDQKCLLEQMDME